MPSLHTQELLRHTPLCTTFLSVQTKRTSSDIQAIKEPLKKRLKKGFGSDRLSHMTLCSIIGNEERTVRVRDGVECTIFSLAAKISEFIVDRVESNLLALSFFFVGSAKIFRLCIVWLFRFAS